MSFSSKQLFVAANAIRVFNPSSALFPWPKLFTRSDERATQPLPDQIGCFEGKKKRPKN